MAKICQAMLDAGITDPESQDGKEFCTGECPYDRCIVFEGRRKTTTKRLKAIVEARELEAQGLSTIEISKRLNKHYRTIRGYLRK